MKYAQFYQRSALDPSQVIEACGDRSVIILDARERHESHVHAASEACKARGYVGYSLHVGESFTRSHLVSQFVPVSCRYTLHQRDGTQVGQAETAQGIADVARPATYSWDITEPAYPFTAWARDSMGLVGTQYRTQSEARAACEREYTK